MVLLHHPRVPCKWDGQPYKCNKINKLTGTKKIIIVPIGPSWIQPSLPNSEMSVEVM